MLWRRTADLIGPALTLVFAVAIVGPAAYVYGQRAAEERYRLMNPWMFQSELAPFERTYGREGRYSIGIEEWLVRDHFRDERSGVFLDVGAADPVEHSNTYFSRI
jgi:hypothetical protein